MTERADAFTVLVTFRALPERVDELVSEISRNAAESAREPGCLEFTVLRNDGDEFEFVLYERYRDERAFRDDHRRTPHYDRWRATASRCIEPGSERRHELRALSVAS